MNIFGFEIVISKNGETPVKKKECHAAHDKLEKSLDIRFTDMKSHFDNRIDDFINATNNYINLLKK